MSFPQQGRGLMVYPGRGWRKALFRFPLWLWRLGLGPILGVQRAGQAENAVAVHVTDEKELAQFYRQAKGKSPVWRQWLDSWGVRDEESDFISRTRIGLSLFGSIPRPRRRPSPCARTLPGCGWCSC